MAWIEIISPEDASGELAEVYKEISTSRGGVAKVHQVQSLNPRVVRAHMELYKAVVFQRSSLSRIERERIAVVVSAANRCDYCIGHHSQALKNLKDDPGIIEELTKGEIPTSLEGRERKLLLWAHKCALHPSESTEKDILELKEAGYDDRAILDATLTIGYFSFVNRLVLLTGLHLEENFASTCNASSGDEHQVFD